MRDVISAVEYLEMGTGLRRSQNARYGNRPGEVDGIKFASQAEIRRYGDLRTERDAGLINNLTCHPKWQLVVNGVRVCSYTADFSYWRDDVFVVEDVKSAATRKKDAYRIKKKLFEALYAPLTITEVDR